MHITTSRSGDTVRHAGNVRRRSARGNPDPLGRIAPIDEPDRVNTFDGTVSAERRAAVLAGQVGPAHPKVNGRAYGRLVSLAGVVVRVDEVVEVQAVAAGRREPRLA